MLEYILVSDRGALGNIITTIDKFYYDEDYLLHFDIKIFSKEAYDYFSFPRKLNCYAYQLATGDSRPLGIMCITATRKSEFSWFTFDHDYSTIGVMGIAMPVGVLKADVFY